MVPGKRGAGVEGMRNVGMVVISMLSVIHPHSPWGPIFRLVCLPRKGQGLSFTEIRSTQVLSDRNNDEERCTLIQTSASDTTLGGKKSSGFYYFYFPLKSKDIAPPPPQLESELQRMLELQ